MNTDRHSSLLDLLDQAYLAADNPEQLDTLLDSTSSYLFEDQKNAIIANNLPRFADMDPHLEKHVSRLETLLEQRTGAEKPGLSLGHHAQLVVAADGRILTANSQAKTLLEAEAGQLVKDLPLSYDSLVALRALTSEIAAGVQHLERMLYLQVETGAPSPVFGYCRAVPASQERTGLHITMTCFDWSPALYASLQQALALSDSERLVLEGILTGQSYGQIAAARQRSLNTVKTQAKAILHKSACSKMSELMHLCTSIAYVIGLSDSIGPKPDAASGWITPRQAMHTLAVGQGRTLAWYEYGDPAGKPVLFVHGFFQGPFFLDAMKHDLLQAGLRLIAPSRPCYGYTSAPVEEDDFEPEAVQDMLALVRHLELRGPLLMAVHHGGASHGFRMARQLGGQLAGMVMIGAGIPVTTEHLKYMSGKKRMISAAARHAPSVLKMLVTVGTKTYRKKGVQAFLRDHYAPRQIDMQALDDANINARICEGIYHLMQQGSAAFVQDGRSQMADWSADLAAVHCRQTWLHGRHCHLMAPRFIEDYVRSKSSHAVEVIEDAGYNILYQSPKRIVDKLSEATSWG